MCYKKILRATENFGLLENNEGDDLISKAMQDEEILNNAYVNVVENVPVGNHSVFLTSMIFLFEQKLILFWKNTNLSHVFEETLSTNKLIVKGTTIDVLKLMKYFNINKAMREDQIPPKLIRPVVSFL